MSNFILILNNQLFDYFYYTKIIEIIYEIKPSNCIYIIYEHPYFFKKYNKIHKLKIAYHRAAMKYYFDNLETKHKIYVNFNDNLNTVLKDNKLKMSDGIMYNPIEKDLIKQFDKLKMSDSPYFLNSHKNNNNIINQVNNIRHDTFYKIQRKSYNILLNKDNEPLFGKWSFDKENRMKFPKDIGSQLFNKGLFDISNDLDISKSLDISYINDAILYVNKYFKNNYGELNISNFIYPINRVDSLKWLANFINNKLNNFGKYEDAMHSEVIFGYHSVLTPMLNIGLIIPYDILNLFRKLQVSSSNIATLEGFIRQVIGWREYNYLIYDFYGDYLTKKFFYSQNKNNISNKIWNCKTNINYIDNILNKVNKYGYCHHIERLMGIGNYLLLKQIKPKEIFKWFSTMYIDAYEVFMVPNVYGMLLYGYIDDKNHMMTRPYFCSSNYIIKMSNYKKLNTENESETIDDLYYDLLKTYKDEFSHIYSTAGAIKRLLK